MKYQEEDFLLISGIQHYLFCKKQWALIHIEQQWSENVLTIDGKILHGNAHNSALDEKRKGVIMVRALRIHSAELGISGECDVVEFHKDSNGIPLNRDKGLWRPYPIEYKRGHIKEDLSDRAQLCAQAMCLEEMLCCDIHEGALFYGETRRRERIEFSEELRDVVRQTTKEMHEIYQRGATPHVKPSRKCKSCSLHDICAPEISTRESIARYMKKVLEEG